MFDLKCILKRKSHIVLSPSYKCITWKFYAQHITFSSISLKIIVKNINIKIKKRGSEWSLCYNRGYNDIKTLYTQNNSEQSNLFFY